MGVYIRNITKEQFIEDCNAMGVLVITEGISEIDLIRCGECKYYDTESRTFPCCTDIFGAVRYMEADGFCSKGERRADDNSIKANK